MDALTRAQYLLLEAHELCYATFGALVRDAGAAAVAAVRAESGLDLETSPSASPVVDSAATPGEAVAGSGVVAAPSRLDKSIVLASEQPRAVLEPGQNQTFATDPGSTRAPSAGTMSETTAETAAMLLVDKFRELEAALVEVGDAVSLQSFVRAFEEHRVPAPPILREASVMNWSLVEPIAAHLRQEYGALASELSMAVEQLAAQLGRTPHGATLLNASTNASS
ncbi:hypothetical protein CCYA_CCYA18G4612 [Cyanidiococcus yangmingshanensis]|nr:hypothetical protein CCYA_CCYA18G4612 [Cyanidiococcus yangmingshanensis]